jgi:tetratricopeptide (TPR) repeat protein
VTSRGFAIASLIGAVVALGCACSSRTEAPAASSTTSAGSPVLVPVTLPDLTAMAAPVRKQVLDRQESLTRATQNPATPAVDLATAYGELGKTLLAAESFVEAEPCFLNAHALAAGDFRWTYYLGQAYRLEGQSKKASMFFERTLQLRPDDVATLVWLGDMYLEQGRLEEAEAVFSKALALQPRTVAARFGLGRAALAKRDYGRAIDQLEAALAQDRRATIVHYPLAMAYRAAGKVEQAEGHLRQRGDTEVGPPDPLMQELNERLDSSVVYENRGDRALAGGDFASAVAHYRKGLNLAPDNLSLRQKEATALSLSGDVPGAVREFQEVLRRSPDFAGAHYSLGVLLLADGQDDLAIERFSAAVRFDPTYIQARLQLANVLRRRGRFEPALRQYAEVVMMDPRVGEARFGSAIALVHLKRYGDARDVLTEAMRLFADRPEFARALSRLYAAAPESGVRDGARALALAQELLKRQQTPDAREMMAMALAEVGQYEAAVKWQREAIASAEQGGGHELAVRMADNLRLYERRQPCRMPWREDPAWEQP